jgi:3-deoxy-manno-octulosonate cytidylyltransferase (CMP-KDO synthetase)
MAATRLPGKPLADIGGVPMIVRVLRQAERAGVGPVAVAAGDAEIVEAVEAAGGRAILTDPNLPSGSDRILAALDLMGGDHDVVINLQGDMPFVEERILVACAALLAGEPSCDIATVVAPEASPADRSNPDVVKAVLSFPKGARGPGALFHPLDALRRRPRVASHRHLRLSPRGAGGVQRSPALAAGEAREAGAVARAGAWP